MQTKTLKPSDDSCNANYKQMAMFCMIRRASSTVIPHAVRPITAICSGAHHFCTDAKKKLLSEKILRALSSEIKSEEQCPIKPMPQIPPNFPFTIVDDPTENCITLKRDFAGQKIELSIRKFDEFNRIVEEDEEEEEEEEESGGVSDKEKSMADRFWPFFEVDVKIMKQSGRTLALQVSAATNKIFPNDMWIEEGDGKQPAIYTVRAMPDDMQAVMREYLETIGLTTSNVGIVYKYLAGRYKRRPLFMLQKLKNCFME